MRVSVQQTPFSGGAVVTIHSLRARLRHLLTGVLAMACIVGLCAGVASAQPTGPSGTTGSSSGVSGASGTTGSTGGPTHVTGLPPATLSSGVDVLTLSLNGAADSASPQPTITPNVAGTWSDWGNHESFKPTTSFAPCGSYTLTVPAGTQASDNAPTRAARTLEFSVACPSVKALQEALARLNYLPYKLESFSGVNLNVALTTGLAAQRAYVLPQGWLKRAYHEAPLLDPGTMDPTTTGALEVWEQDHDIAIGTTPDSAIWHRLLREEALNARNPRPYTWVTVTENTTPELLKVHENGHVVITSPTNTGIPGRTTATGEYPIYVRYTSTTMSGTNPDGSHYDDPGVPWVNYFNGGDAVHGFPRASYGSPQSLGCVELPIPTAEKVFYKLMVGDMVDVSD
jgi:hypothetical protein